MINIDDEKDNIVNKKEKSIPLITSIYYDNKNKENENNLFLNDLRITYEILENDEKKNEDILLKEFLKKDENIEIIKNDCKNHNTKGEKYCLKCHYWLCEECVEDHMKNKPLHPLNDDELNLINICNEHKNKNLTLFCKDCNKFICHECVNEKHLNHSYEKIKDKFKKEKENYLYYYYENIEDLINDSNDLLLKYSKKINEFINKSINDLNEIKNNIKNKVNKIKEDNELIKTLCYNMNKQMKLARNYPNNNIIQSIKNLNFNEIDSNITYYIQNNNFIKDLKNDINKTLNQIICFNKNSKNNENENKNDKNNLINNLTENNFKKDSIQLNKINNNNSLFGNSNNNTNNIFKGLSNNNNNSIFGGSNNYNNNNNNLFGLFNNNYEKDYKNFFGNNSSSTQNNNNNSFFLDKENGNKNNIILNNNTNIFTVQTKENIDPFKQINKDFELKTNDKNSLFNNNKLNSTYNNLFPNLSHISYQETQFSDNDDYDDDNETVYITSSGSCYHSENCRYVRRSCIPIKKKDAIRKGYYACSRC